MQKKLKEIAINPRHKRILGIKKELVYCAKQQIKKATGENLAGFALVTWTMTGRAACSVMADAGIVSQSFVPTYVRDVLNRYVSKGVYTLEDTPDDKDGA